MGQDRLEKGRENLTKLNAAKKAANTEYPKLRITTVGMLDSLDELSRSVDFAAEFEASEGVRMSYFRSHEEDMNELMPLNGADAVTTAIEEAVVYAESRNVSFEPIGGSIDEIERDVDKALGHRWCAQPWETLSLQPNGDVYPCAVAYTKVGNFFDNTLEEIWNGEKLAAFRNGVNSPDRMNEDCRKCSHCRYGSVLDPVANDFSATDEYVGGMRRKK